VRVPEISAIEAERHREHLILLGDVGWGERRVRSRDYWSSSSSHSGFSQVGKWPVMPASRTAFRLSLQ